MQTEWSPGADDSTGTPVPAPWSSAAPGAVADGTVADGAGADVDRGDGGSAPDGEVVAEDEQHRTAVDAVDRLLDEVERALARLDDGTYGRCEACGEPIADDRLSEHPIASTCARCDEVDGGTAVAAAEPAT
jgi:RNA polymerase-binding transcription factor